jgi:hypothetical protein
MTQIRTAEDIAKEMFEVSMDKDTSILVLPDELIKAMQEYAKQFIYLAVEEAEIIYKSDGYAYIKEESILNIKDLIK